MKLSRATSSSIHLALSLSSLWMYHATASASDSLAVQAGYHVVYSYPGLTPPQSLMDSIQQGLVGGIILFGENVGSSTADTIQSFQDAYKQSPAYSGYPLFITTDQEGGEVNRIPGGPSQSAKDVGASSDPSYAATMQGDEAANVLSGSNLNSNLAPVLGVYRQAGDFLDQYERSYSMNATIVGECVESFITALQEGGVFATAKHFPGLGAATADENTDAEPVTINLSLSELRSVDEAPYVNAIGAGVKMVMPSWALYPALDPDYPSGLSSKWIQGELRGRLGFTGVTISDAIEAGGLDAFGSDDGQRGVLASQAGMDIILAAALNATQGQVVVNALVSALSDGTLDQSAFDASTQRILDLRSEL